MKDRILSRIVVCSSVVVSSFAFFVVDAVAQSNNCDTCVYEDEEIMESGNKWVYDPDWGDCEDAGGSQLVCFEEEYPTLIEVDIYEPDGNGGWVYEDTIELNNNQCYHNDTMCY